MSNSLKPTSGPTQDAFEEVEFCLKVGGKFAVSASAGGEVSLTKVQNGTTNIFTIDPDTASRIADAIKAIACCAEAGRKQPRRQ